MSFESSTFYFFCHTRLEAQVVPKSINSKSLRIGLLSCVLIRRENLKGICSIRDSQVSFCKEKKECLLEATG